MFKSSKQKKYILLNVGTTPKFGLFSVADALKCLSYENKKIF